MPALPVAALRLESDRLETLATLGLDTIATVASLPRGPLYGDGIIKRAEALSDGRVRLATRHAVHRA